ncbi:glycosyltransferase family 2 protein [Flavobacterium sp. ZS1P70]|uniref:Glycosyltransferase family 2 protein n=1 Tax=Flavobacterium zhoui TaxID=3230414 RepID=A0ABW6I7B6_9FLAO
MLSIIIPYYKITFFDKTIQSLANQTNKNFKVFIGDDNSQNNPSELLEKYKGKFQFQYTKFDENFGSNDLVQQWNRCIELDNSENKWLMILGDDDVLDKNVVEEFHNQRNKFEDSINVVRFSTIKINQKGDFISDIYYNPITENSADFLFRETRSSLSEYVFRKDDLIKTTIKKFPLAWYSDVLAVLEVSDFKEIYSINEAVVKIRISDESISGNSDNMSKKIKASFQFYYYLLYCKNEFFTENQRQILLQKLNNSYFHRKKSAMNFFKISFLHLKYFSTKEYLNFLKSFWQKIKK